MSRQENDYYQINNWPAMTRLFEVTNNLSSKDQLKQLELNPDLLNKAWSEISEYQKAAQKVLETNSELSKKTLDQNHAVAGVILQNYRDTFDALRGLMNDPNASFEQKQFWWEALCKLHDDSDKFDTKNKTFIAETNKTSQSSALKMLKIVGGAIAATVGIGITALVSSNKEQTPILLTKKDLKKRK